MAFMELRHGNLHYLEPSTKQASELVRRYYGVREQPDSGRMVKNIGMFVPTL